MFVTGKQGDTRQSAGTKHFWGSYAKVNLWPDSTEVLRLTLWGRIMGGTDGCFGPYLGKAFSLMGDCIAVLFELIQQNPVFFAFSLDCNSKVLLSVLKRNHSSSCQQVIFSLVNVGWSQYLRSLSCLLFLWPLSSFSVLPMLVSEAPRSSKYGVCCVVFNFCDYYVMSCMRMMLVLCQKVFLPFIVHFLWRFQKWCQCFWRRSLLHHWVRNVNVNIWPLG